MSTKESLLVYKTKRRKSKKFCLQNTFNWTKIRYKTKMSNNKDRDIKPEFYATKLYLSKLSEKYKNRGYEKVFLENDFNYLWDVKEIIKNINELNDDLDNLTLRITKTISKLSKLENLDPKVKKILVEDNIYLFAEIMKFSEKIIKNEDVVVQAIDRFRKIEKEIDAKTKTLTKHWFDKELEYAYKNLLEKKHKELTIVIFDMNNLKTINEMYGHSTWSESIYKFWNILKEEIQRSKVKYLLSNYFWWDEWFLVLLDTTQNQAIDLVKRLFVTLKNNTYEIKENQIKLSACAWIAHYHPTKNQIEKIWPKNILQVADTLVLKSKIKKNRNKSWNAFKALNVTNMTSEEIKLITKEIQTIPKKFNKKTLDKKKLMELFEIRKKQNDKIMRARTLWEKKVLRYNLDTINEVIWYKIVESITKALEETKAHTLISVPVIARKAIKMAINEIERNQNEILLIEDEKEIILEKVIKSVEFQKFMKSEIWDIYESNIFNIERRIWRR